MVRTFLTPRDAAEACALLRSREGALPLAGGTFLLSGAVRSGDFDVISLAGILPAGITRRADADGAISTITIGANTTFQDIIDSPAAPAILKAAARGMADRNIRNRATVGGNIGADKSCASLVPVFLVLDTAYELADGTALPATDWHSAPRGPNRGIIARVTLRLPLGVRCGYGRWSRSSCDLSLLGVAVAFGTDNSGAIRGARVALGGVAPGVRRFPAIEAALESLRPTDRERIESLVASFVSPIGDARGSAEFKRARIAMLAADTLAGATTEAEAEA